MSLDETTVSPRPPLEQFRLGAALLFFCAVIAYLPAINAGFIWDDDLLLTANPQMGSVRGLGEIWLGRNCCDYTPVTLTAFWLEHELWGDTATGYHVVNILLHALAAVLLWHNLSILRIRGSWLAALLFVIHPVNVASVAWIAELKNTLSAVFFFASILAFLYLARAAKQTDLHPIHFAVCPGWAVQRRCRRAAARFVRLHCLEEGTRHAPRFASRNAVRTHRHR